MCYAMGRINESSKERARQYMDEMSDETEKSHDRWESKIYNAIFIGMPKDDFENNFSEYIFKKEGNMIYFYEPETQNKSRVTFNNGRLIKYERYGQYYGGIGPAVYSDQSFLLKNYAPPNQEYPAQ
jgi:hypothetical protein